MNSKQIDYSNDIEVKTYLHGILHKLLHGLRTLVRSNTKLSKSIGDNYEKALIKFVDYIPNKHMRLIFESAESIFALLSCIDIDKLIKNKYAIRLPFSQQTIIDGSKASVNKLKQILFIVIEDKFKEASEREFLKSLMGKLDPVFDSLIYICENTPSCIENCTYFKVIEDIF